MTAKPTPPNPDEEREQMIGEGLLPNPNECTAAWGMTVDPFPHPGILAAEYELVLHRLANQLSAAEAARDSAVREGYELRDGLQRIGRALDYLHARHPLTEPQREMVAHVLGWDQ